MSFSPMANMYIANDLMHSKYCCALLLSFGGLRCIRSFAMYSRLGHFSIAKTIKIDLFFFVHEHRAEYTPLGLVTEFKYSKDVGHVFHGYKELKWLTSILTASDLLPSKNAFVFVDNHDNQRSKDGDILTYKNRSQYIMAVAFMLSFPYGLPRVMSSFDFSSFIQGSKHRCDSLFSSFNLTIFTEFLNRFHIPKHRSTG